MKKLYSLFAIILSLVLITGCGSNNSNTNDNQTSATTKSTIICTGKIDGQDVTMTAKLDNGEVIKITQVGKMIFDSKDDAQSEYSMYTMMSSILKDVEGITYDVKLSDKTINVEMVIEISKLKSFVNNNQDVADMFSLDEFLLETENEYKNYANKNGLTCQVD